MSGVQPRDVRDGLRRTAARRAGTERDRTGCEAVGGARWSRRSDAGDVGHGGAPSLACGDTVLNDQATSGGEQLTHTVPCSTIDSPPSPPKPARILDADSDARVAPPAPVEEPPPPKKKGPAIQAPTR